MRYRGFSLIELMVTIAILAILVAIGLPSFQGSMRSNLVATGTNELMASLALARSEAIRSPGGAGICASQDGESCGGTWNDGWIVWSDLDGDGEPGEDDRVLRYIEGIARLDIELAADTILFDRRGRADAQRQFDIQPETCPGGHELVRELVVMSTGRASVTRSSCT